MSEKQRATVSGNPPSRDCWNTGAPQPINPETGQHTDYWVLPEEERLKGFVRPVRNSYLHKTCLTETRMGLALAETYARDPEYYGATFCCQCRSHFPVSEFTWIPDGSEVGS